MQFNRDEIFKNLCRKISSISNKHLNIMEIKKIIFSSFNKVNIHQIPKSEEDIIINKLERKIISILIENDEMALFVRR